MPELPEVEAVRRSLVGAVVGRRVAAVAVHRGDVVRGACTAAALLQGRVIAGIDRRGKELALVGDTGGCVCVHLGMSGSLTVTRGAGVAPVGHAKHPLPRPLPPPEPGEGGAREKHTHVMWTLDDGSVLRFRDPRRFGGVWTFACATERDAQRWHTRGEDALTITPTRLAREFRGSVAVKAALLDQRRVAGVGNIYADEVLFAAGVHPLTPAGRLDAAMLRTLVGHLRRILRAAIRAGGSTLRDGTYLDGRGQPGRFQARHAVYGRAGQPCVRCGTLLRGITVAGRTTVFCPTCQCRVVFCDD